MLFPLVLALMTQAPAEAAPVTPPPREIARGVHLIPGAMLPDRGPDGNTIVFDAPEGLIVIDTGRHAWHSDAILAFAAAQGRPIAAILNTHWHLDHSSGNGRLKAAFPNARLYTTTAIDRALAENGFLTRNMAGARAMLEGDQISGAQREEVQIFLDTMQTADTLRPDAPVTASARMRIAGRSFDVRVAERAVSDADLWLYDRRTRVAVIGDFVTFPAPFFETGCPEGWRAALDAVWATPFRIAIAGHGEPMTRDQFNLYRTAYGAFIDCVASNAEPGVCASGWTERVAPFLTDDGSRRDAPQMAEYYVGYLRENGGKNPDCLTR
jgi:glyoxylase-like metal-dependent hydrolase (beta-lactamase superfamily II)